MRLLDLADFPISLPFFFLAILYDSIVIDQIKTKVQWSTKVMFVGLSLDLSASLDLAMTTGFEICRVVGNRIVDDRRNFRPSWRLTRRSKWYRMGLAQYTCYGIDSKWKLIYQLVCKMIQIWIMIKRVDLELTSSLSTITTSKIKHRSLLRSTQS